MSETLREINLTPEFLDGLAAIQAYHGQFDAAKAQQPTSALFDFAYDIVGPFP